MGLQINVYLVDSVPVISVIWWAGEGLAIISCACRRSFPIIPTSSCCCSGSAIALFEDPVSSTHGTLLFITGGTYPLDYTMHVEAMRTLPPNYGAVVPGEGTLCTTPVEQIPTNATRIVIGDPVPCSNRRPLFYFYFHCGAKSDNHF